MPYIIPAAAIAIGIWGVKKVFTQDDSADQKAAEVIKSIPKHIRDNVEVKPTDTGLLITPKIDAPSGIEQELEKNIQIEE